MAALVALGLGAPTLHAQVPGVSTQTIDVDGISTRYHEFRLEDVQDTIHVSSPTGEQEADRASILAALERARAGDVVQFGPGTYLVGELIPIETPQLTMLGHPNGTTLRGCEPDPYEQLERDRQAARDDQQARLLIMRRCGVFEMTGGHGTVRGLTFEHSWMGLALGAASSIEDRMTEGGYLVENNVFRNSGNGVRPAYLSSAPTVIRGNRFMNVFHALSGAGAGFHVVDNDISVPEPDPIALPDGPGFAIGIDGAEGCVIEGNRIEGHRAGIVLFGVPGRPTRRNVIRDNTIIVRRARFFGDRSPGLIRHETDSTLVGIPLVLADWSEESSTESRGVIENNVIEGNRIIGAEGLGMMLHRASRNRVADNTITGIRRREPFPGNVLWGIDEEQWRHANGSAIWVSPGSDGNEIIGNTFEDVAAFAVVVEGDNNRIDLRSESDSVRDLGSSNRVTTGAATSADPQPLAQRPRTITERLVDVGGFQMQVWTGGPEPSEGGPPLVVFENGRSGIAGTWAEVAKEVASFAPFLAYNRGGRGLSEWDGEPPTPEHVARRLRDLLDVLDLPPPYLLVGHSWGAHLVREHAALHPDAVAGLVYVDPYAPCAVERAFETAGFGPLVAEFTDFLAQRSGPIPDPLHLRTDRELGSGAPPDIPVVLMVGLKEGPPPPGAREWMVKRGIDPDEILAARRELKVPCLSSMALEVPRGKLIATPSSGHDIQQDEPELVGEAIRWVLSRMPGSVEPGNGQATEFHVPLQSQESP